MLDQQRSKAEWRTRQLLPGSGIVRRENKPRSRFWIFWIHSYSRYLNDKIKNVRRRLNAKTSRLSSITRSSAATVIGSRTVISIQKVNTRLLRGMIVGHWIEFLSTSYKNINDVAESKLEAVLTGENEDSI
mmetsp:Transcript_5240/g.8615  ORF Transcript_5240/g.8615 Transcript_5240/m.8615 type:complete len:131 (+) Transcript_5240:310-702(+)